MININFQLSTIDKLFNEFSSTQNMLKGPLFEMISSIRKTSSKNVSNKQVYWPFRNHYSDLDVSILKWCVYDSEDIVWQTFLFNYLMYVYNDFNSLDLLSKTVFWASSLYILCCCPIFPIPMASLENVRYLVIISTNRRRQLE